MENGRKREAENGRKRRQEDRRKAGVGWRRKKGGEGRGRGEDKTSETIRNSRLTK